MANKEEFRVVQRLVVHWDKLVAQLRALNGQVQLFPDNGTDIFKPSEEPPSTLGSVRIDLSPVALRVPERADAFPLNMFIAVAGFLEIDPGQLDDSSFVITSFGTRIAYFRRVKNSFDHVFGAHFDYSENQTAHPVFHAQLRNLEDMLPIVKSQLDVQGELRNNGCKGMLSNVRLPTAQLDVFSLLLQVFADHLVQDKSAKEVKAAFNSLLDLAATRQGAGHRTPRFKTENVAVCMSSRHWYPHAAL